MSYEGMTNLKVADILSKIGVKNSHLEHPFGPIAGASIPTVTREELGMKAPMDRRTWIMTAFQEGRKVVTIHEPDGTHWSNKVREWWLEQGYSLDDLQWVHSTVVTEGNQFHITWAVATKKQATMLKMFWG